MKFPCAKYCHPFVSARGCFQDPPEDTKILGCSTPLLSALTTYRFNQLWIESFNPSLAESTDAEPADTGVTHAKVNQLQPLQGEKARFSETISKYQRTIPAADIHKKVTVLISRIISCFPLS